jgi:hypothetical protein
MVLITRFVLGLIGDVLFDATASRVRTYESEIERYFDERGFRRPTAASPRRSV